MTSHDDPTRLALDFTLAAVLTAYPARDFADAVTSLLARGAGADAAGRLDAMLSRMTRVEDVETAYCALFEHGDARSSLYETEYGRMRGMSKGNDLADIAGFYRAFGMSLDDSGPKEMVDHLAVELEFYAFLVAKEAALEEAGLGDGVAVVRDARRAFLHSHLGRLASSVNARVHVMADPTYAGVFAWCAALVLRECTNLGVEPAPLDFFADIELDKPTDCADSGLPILPT